MLAYARTLVGKPFSNMGMARSIFFPRKTDGESFFCAGAPRPAPASLEAADAPRCARRARRRHPQEGGAHVRAPARCTMRAGPPC
jgi:hypothetical protein